MLQSRPVFKTAADNLKFSESRPMVIALIDDMRAYRANKFRRATTGKFPMRLPSWEGELA